MIFYDFEVFKHDWMVVFADTDAKETVRIVNDKAALEDFYNANRNRIHVGYNSRNYDQWIYKAILAGFDPKKANDWIIAKGRKGWEFSGALRAFSFINYDVYQNIDRGLKYFEGSLGNDIRETSVPFDIDRKLTPAEIAEVLDYCEHDVEQTMAVFIERKADFNAQMGLLKMFDLPLSDLNKTKPQLSAKILGASRRSYDDEFDIDLPDTLRLEKYAHVAEWYQNPVNRKYTVDPNDEKSAKNVLRTEIAGVPHVFGWGGVHGALEKYSGHGYYINMDVASLYPSLMIRYDLHSRSCKPEKFTEIYHQRLAYKKEKNPLQAPLKIVLNSTYGAMKDTYNPLYDPRQSNRVCVYGQLLLLDLMEHLEPFCEIIQSNTDGVLVKMPDDVPASYLIQDYEARCDAFYKVIDEVAWEWEQRTGLVLEFDEFSTIYQKDVNNYIMVAPDGSYKSKGAYVKKLGALDYDLAVVNRAVTDYMVHGTPVETTITACGNLKDFQMVARCSGKYAGFEYMGRRLNERTVRVFAAKDRRLGGIVKVHSGTGRPAKVAGTPEHCMLINHDINGEKVPPELDLQWYIDLACKRLEDFGVRRYGTIQGLYSHY